MKVVYGLIISSLLLISFMAFSRTGKTIYKYKKFEKFDFEQMVIEGETGSPGDLSIMTRFQRKFKNKLPYRKNFNAEIKKAVERVR